MDDDEISRQIIQDMIIQKLEEYMLPKISYKLMQDDNELCPSHGRTILTTLDGKVVVNPSAPDYIELEHCFKYLSEVGKERWNKGLSISYLDCFRDTVSKKVGKGYV
jgi:hypothetical protein